MAIFKCKMCGANLEVAEKATVAECEYCGTSQTLPKLDNDRRAALYDRAGHFRRNNDFDKASALYEQILNEDVTDAEAYWSLVLCRFGIQYVEDPKTKKRIPTVNRTQRTSIFDDANYKSALEYADAEQKALYESEATTINEIQKGILAISQKEEPFDVFICYKESDAEGKRTPDSVLAQELYFGLERAGFKVFFSRITLEKKLGEAYEPYIFAALQSSKVMVVMGTKPEYFNAVWVKNEWSRYLRLIDEDPSKKLIPAFKDMDAYDLPEEFSLLQAQDMSKLGFMQDLILGIEKIAGKKEEEHAAPAAGAADVVGVKQLLTRAGMCLEDGDWGRADEFCEEVLNRDPECAEAWAYKLCIDTHSRNVASLKNLKENFSKNKNYQKALRFAGTELKAKLHGILTFIDDRNEEERKQKIYAEAAQLYSRATYQRDYDAAAELFAKIPGFKDANDRVEICKKEGEIARKEAIYTQALAAYNSTTPSVILSSKQKFLSVADYKDAGELASLVEETAERARRANLCNGARGVLNSINEYAKIDRAIADMDSIAAADPDAKDLADRLRSKKQGLIDAENRKIAEQKRLEAERIAAAKRRKRQALTKKLVKFAVIIGLILGLAYFLYYVFWLKPNAQYSDGLAQIEEGEWDAAILIFEDLKDFRNSKAKLMESLAGKGTELAEEEKFEEAYGYFDRIHETYNSLKSSKKNEYLLDYQISVYKYGEALLLDEGMERKAAVKFGIAIGWEDAKERSFALWNEARTVKHVEIGIRLGAVSNAYEGVVILRTDGTVVSQHGSPDFQKTIAEWTDIVEIAACHNYLAAINSQGDMFVANYYTSGKTFDDQWTNIADIDSYETHDVLYAVRADGRVMFSDDDNLTQTVAAWDGQEVTQVSVGQNSIAGLTTNGTALYWTRSSYSYNSSEPTGIESWTDLVQVEMGDNYVYALKSDGTVVTNNLNLFDELATWENVREIRLTSRVAWGLTEGGTLLGTDKTKDAEWRSRSGISEFTAFTDKLITVNENGKLSPYNYGEFTEESINP